MVLWPALAGAGSRNWFPEYPLQHCGMHPLLVRAPERQARAEMLEVCAISAPPDEKAAGSRLRAFTITVRDPSWRVDHPASAARVHPMEARLRVAARGREYLFYELVTPLSLDGQRHLLLLPLVNGVPDGYRGGRLLLFIYDAQTWRFTQAFETELPDGSTAPSVELRTPRGQTTKRVSLTYQQGGVQETIPLVWTGPDALARGPVTSSRDGGHAGDGSAVQPAR